MLATAGVFAPNGDFHLAPPGGWQELAEIWRHTVLRRRTAWRELIQQVWGADPLQCPLCSGLLRPIAVVETKAQIAAILAPLGLFRPHEHPFAAGPPRPEVAFLVDLPAGRQAPWFCLRPSP
jgi:hypothetical protein